MRRESMKKRIGVLLAAAISIAQWQPVTVQAEASDVFKGDVTLTPAGKVQAKEFVSGTNLIAYQDTDGSYALMDLNGNLLTETAYSEILVGMNGYIAAQLNDGSGKFGVLAEDGSVVVDFQYDVAYALGDSWAVGAVMTKGGTEEDYNLNDDDGNYSGIDHYDFYYIEDQKAQYVGELGGDDYCDAACSGDKINIEAKNGVITTYDSTFHAVRTADSLYDFGEDSQEEAAQETTGYFLSIGNEQTVFMTGDGTVSASFPYGYKNTEDIEGCGMSVKVEKNDGSFVLLAADGKETDLGTVYSNIRAFEESQGMFWIGAQVGRAGYNLMDWHGNLLLTAGVEYSISADGNYLISRDGSIYMINDAPPIDFTGEKGAIQVEIKEGTSLEPFTGEVTIKDEGPVASEQFIEYTDLLMATDDGSRYAVMDVTGTQYSEQKYSDDMHYNAGFIILEDADTKKKGAMKVQNAKLVVPCEYDYVTAIGSKWIAAYFLKEGTEEDYDFDFNYDDNYYQIETAVIYHIGEDEITSKELTRDQLGETGTDGDYINIEDRTSGKITTYDASFQAVEEVNYVGDFRNYSYRDALEREIGNKSIYRVEIIYGDGYVQGSDPTNEDALGIMDMNGNVIIPFVYDGIWLSNIKGYFYVGKDNKVGFVTAGGAVSCELKYDSENFTCSGAAGTYENEDGTYTIVAADGTESGPYDVEPYGRALGLLFKIWTGTGYTLVDWHGNELLKDYKDFSFGSSGKYFIAQKKDGDPYELFTINGVEVEGIAEE